MTEQDDVSASRRKVFDVSNSIAASLSQILSAMVNNSGLQSEEMFQAIEIASAMIASNIIVSSSCSLKDDLAPTWDAKLAFERESFITTLDKLLSQIDETAWRGVEFDLMEMKGTA